MGVGKKFAMATLRGSFGAFARGISARRGNRRACSATIAVLFLIAAFGGASAFASRPPNVVLLVSDDQRADTIGAYGNRIVATPNLDRLAEQGVRFTRAVSPNPICVPSRAEIMSGYSTLRPGVLNLRDGRGRPLTTLAQTMWQGGYHTWYVGKWHSAGRPRDRGYDESLGLFTGGVRAKDVPAAVDYKGRPVTGYVGWVFQTDSGKLFPEKGIGLTPAISTSFANAAVALIERKPDRPFFLHVNFTAPHDPLLWPPGYEKKYPSENVPLPPNFAAVHPFDHGNLDGRDERLWPTPRTPQDVREELAVYYAVIEHMDAEIGRILKTLETTGQSENTIVVFASDQGLAIGSHGLRGKQNMYDHTIGTPLIMRGPGLPHGSVRTAQVYLRDLYPTVVELCGLPVPKTIDGRSFAGVLRGEVSAFHPVVVGNFLDSQRMIRTEEHKLVWYPKLDRYQLFDLRRDPHELLDLSDAAAYASVRNRLRQQLTEELAKLSAAP